MTSVDPSSPPEDDALVPVPIPPLVAILAALEERKGAALTEDEVLSARDDAVCMQMSRAVARQMERARGYADIDPTDVWAAWQRFRHRPES